MHARIYGSPVHQFESRGPLGHCPNRGTTTACRRQLATRFRRGDCRHRTGQTTPIFSRSPAEELYGCSREENPNLPDLMLVPHPGFAVVRKIRGRRPVRWCDPAPARGDAPVEGILRCVGPTSAAASASMRTLSILRRPPCRAGAARAGGHGSRVIREALPSSRWSSRNRRSKKPAARRGSLHRGDRRRAGEGSAIWDTSNSRRVEKMKDEGLG